MNLQQLTNKPTILTPSGDDALELALQRVKEKGYTQLFIPDMGGWKEYEPLGKKYGFTINTLKTNLGIIDFSQVEEGSVVLFHTMPAYAFNQDYDYEALKKKNIFVIADISGDEGRRIPEGDVLLGSFGRWKVVSNNYGGFIACDEPFTPIPLDQEKLTSLPSLLEHLPERWAFFREQRKKIIEDLSEKDIIRPEDDGVNIIVKGVEEDIITYCKEHKLPYKTCPFPIRVTIPAVSIELKRLP